MEGRFIDYYSLLGISKDADTATIKKAYREAAKKYHPDVNKSVRITAEIRNKEKMQAVNEAKEILLDERKREEYNKAYDAEMSRRRAEQEYAYRQYTQPRREQAYTNTRTQTETRRETTSRNTEYTRAQTDQRRAQQNRTTQTTRTQTQSRNTQTKTNSKVKKRTIKTESMFDRQDRITKIISKKYPDASMLERVATHVCKELEYRFQDHNIKDFVIRNKAALASILLTGVMAVAICFPKEKPVVIPASTTEVSTTSHEQDENTIVLHRDYIIQPDDTLWNLADSLGTTVDHLASANDIENPNDIRSGDTLDINYCISKDDIKYCTKSKDIKDFYPEFRATYRLHQIAKMYNTDIDTLAELNSEAIEVETIHYEGDEETEPYEYNEYYILSDTILVPTYPRETISLGKYISEQKKAANEQKVYTNQG